MGEGIATTAEAEEAQVLADHGAVGTSDSATAPAETEALAHRIAEGAKGKLGPAHFAYQRLILYIRNFEKTLTPDEEVAIGQTATGTGILKIEGIGYFDPDLVTFYGRDNNGAKTQLIQHVSQLNVVLKAVQKAPENEAPRRIGFELAREIGAEQPDS